MLLTPRDPRVVRRPGGGEEHGSVRPGFELDERGGSCDSFVGRGLAALFRGEKSKRWIDYAFAATLMGVAIWMALPLFHR